MTGGIQEIIAALFAAEPARVQFVGGGSINQAARIDVRGETYFVKWLNDAPPGFFESEAAGLDLLRSTGTLRVPEVVGYAEAQGQRPAYLILEWLDETRQVEPLTFAVTFGRAVAQLHRNTGQQFGLDSDNYIGSLRQINTPGTDWLTFYRERRLLPQMALARERGRLGAEREKRLNRLIERLDKLLAGSARQPALLHGDLWSGNFMVVAGSQPVVVDPAVYYGDREVDLAFTELFGGFPPGFLAAYREAYPLEPGYERRRPIYQLYPLLVHLNLFGESYGARIDQICRMYVN